MRAGRSTPARSSNAVRGTPEHDALNNPKPNTIYKLDNGETFRTNGYGFLDQIEYRPTKDRRGRNRMQTQVGKLGVKEDVGGHLRGANQGGSTDRYNLIPQNARFNNSDYRKWENEIFDNIDDVSSIKIHLIRKDAGAARPDSLEIIYYISGKRYRKYFENREGIQK